MQNIRTLYDEALQNCHSERSEESNAETLRGVYPERSRRAQGYNPSVSILCSLSHNLRQSRRLGNREPLKAAIVDISGATQGGQDGQTRSHPRWLLLEQR